MEQNNKDTLVQHGELNDYSEILRHAVAVFEHARTEIARQINGHVWNMKKFYERYVLGIL